MAEPYTRRRFLGRTGAAGLALGLSSLLSACGIEGEAQKRGAVISGGWTCGTQVYYVTLRAFVIDADGNRSNAITYTIHCNGG